MGSSQERALEERLDLIDSLIKKEQAGCLWEGVVDGDSRDQASAAVAEGARNGHVRLY